MFSSTFFSSLIVLSSVLALAHPTADRLQPRDNTSVGISQALLDNFQLFANFTSAAYCPNNENATAGSLITCADTYCPLVEANDATVLVSFGGSGDTSLTNIKGFVALDPANSAIVVAFAGSGATVRNWIANFAFILVPYTAIASCKSCWTHSGFLTGWTERRTAVIDAVTAAKAANPSYSIVITGHSIGASTATFAAAELRDMGYTVDTYTFGSPRVGNPAFASFVTIQAPASGENYRMTHLNDPVPQIPPTWIGYEHTSPEYWLSGGTDVTNEYEASSVVVCEGLGNTNCNAGEGLIPIDGTSHSHYLGLIDGCAGGVSW